MSVFEQPMPAYRLAETHYGDDLQSLATREISDANRWVELVWLNNLIPPYITDDPRRVVPGVLLSGSLIKVPSPAGVYTDGAATGQVFERDCILKKKRLMVSDSGDIAIAAGVDNLSQQLLHRVVTPRGQATRHPNYGCLIWRLVGKVNGPLASLLGAQYVRSALVADYRVASAPKSSATVTGDIITISSRAIAIEGGYVDLQIDTSANPI